MSRVIDALIVNICNGGEEETTGRWHGFPTTKEDLQQTLSEIGATSTGSHDVFISKCEFRIYGLEGHLGKGADISELNYLATLMEGFTEEQHDTFCAAVEAGKHCSSLKDLINLTKNLDCFDIQPAFSPKEYGAFHINLNRDEYADVMGHLEVSGDPLEQGFFAYVAEIESNVDLEAYGKLQAEKEGGAFTDYGYVTERGYISDNYEGPQDIPEEYQVYSPPEQEANIEDRPFAYVCSPYRGDVEANTEKARAYCRELYESGYTPIAPHLLFPQFLNDNNPAEREAGMAMAAAFLPQCRVLAVCGSEISNGMAKEIQEAERLRIPILTLNVILPETTHDRPLAASLSVLKQIADARAARREAADTQPAKQKTPNKSEPEL